ncbi:transmembrane protein 86A [Capsaspora owczarzaki ATCC 30864]|uniref:transmembrane protein 86A n=1 Tax=Capsaspora owczarzaki (strain ATCC 30864) TaxID=595528 RepID=UPI0001FE53CC|nr:transmembrane protein 86A [Capsaspora owczarzaki ATCC 30864]|eukprot:XP_004349187.1 transmembrane protein 86A [Capsaspora owczarzaki ATCC 30864]
MKKTLASILCLASAALFTGILCERDFNMPLGIAPLITGEPNKISSSDVYAVFKLLPMFFLLVVVYTSGLGQRYNLLVFFGLIASSFGDYFLVYQNVDKMYFVYGMASFGLAHLLYVLALGFRPLRLGLAVIPFSLGIASQYNLMLGTLPEKLVIPVGIYHLLIASMIWRALARKSVPHADGTSPSLAAYGALLFGVSDSLLGLNKFRYPFVQAHLVVMVTYYAAQFLIAHSVAKRKAKTA